jgi:hypothetical protein
MKDLPCKKPAADWRMICFHKEQNLAVGDDRVSVQNSAVPNRAAKGQRTAVRGGVPWAADSALSDFLDT